MLERLNPILRLICAGLAVLLAWQVSRAVAGKNPLENVTAPQMVSSPVSAPTNAPGKTTNRVSRATLPGKRTDFPAAIQEHLDRIVRSELLGPVIRPMPMALLGLAGNEALLRATNGQTGWVRAGEEMGGIKLLRIAANRVLVEVDNKQQELTIFAGFGSESLLPKEKNHETSTQPTP